MNMTMDTSTTRPSTVVGVFEDHEHARDAIEALKDEGFDADSISVLAPDTQVTRDIADDTGSHAGSGAATGAVAGGVLGGLGGWLIGIGALAIPGIGPFIAAGAFATALGGAAIGAGVGAIAGALMGMGIPEDHARYYEGEAKAGRTLVTVRADDDYDYARQTLLDHGAYDVESRAGTADLAATRSSDDRTLAGAQTADRMQLREEELVVSKDMVETGEVRLDKKMVVEHRTVDVPVMREEVTVERTPVDRRPADSPMDDGDQTIRVPVREERVEVAKRPVVYEEVGVVTREVEEKRPVSDTVKREEVRVDRDGDVDVEERR
jgi:uncharacterized protein (TIGR02271 family)